MMRARTIQISPSQRAALRAAFILGFDSSTHALCCGAGGLDVIAQIFDESHLPADQRVVTDRVREWLYNATGCDPHRRDDGDKLAHYLAKIDALDELSLVSDEERVIELEGN